MVCQYTHYIILGIHSVCKKLAWSMFVVWGIV